jgi:osmoprotectant transport system ATP-binding protein
MLELARIAVVLGDKTALSDISLVVPAGQTTVLVGPSGCGKSTLMRVILGLVSPSRGDVQFGGIRLTEHNALELRRKMGYVVQEGGLFPHLTAFGNVTLLARHLGWEAAGMNERVLELARLVQLAPDLLRYFPAQLSGGQRQRVSLMRALMLDPAVLLLDEPLGAIDPIVRHDLQGDLKRIFASLGKTVLLITHDLAEAAFFADRVVLLDGGRIVQQGTFRELSQAPAEPFVSRFLRAHRPLPLVPGEVGSG